MSLIKWSPFPFEPFESMEKMLDEMSRSVVPASSIIPPVDMYETADSVVVEMPVPGADPNKIDISIENGILSVKGSSERKTEVEEKNYYRKEVRYGTVFRQIALPARVDENRAEASFENGLLKVTVPKLKEQKNIKVSVKKK